MSTEFIDFAKQKPKSPGWRAIRTASMGDDCHAIAYYESGAWWQYGIVGNVIRVRSEIKDVVQWRLLTIAERKELRKAQR